MTNAAIPDIRLPDDARPADGRFCSGPSKVRPEAVAALAEAASGYLGTSHRKPTVRRVMRSLRDGLGELFSLPEGYEVVFGNGGTTAFWDAAVFGIIERRSQHLVCGEFSSKFAKAAAAAPFLDGADVMEAPAGTRPDPKPDPSVDAYALIHNETSTGVVTPVRRVEGAEGLILVDATSGAGALRVDPAAFDVYYFAPQKCFASDGGLWVALCSPAAIERIERIKASGRWIPPSLDLTIALANSRQDQTYNTQALATVFLFDHQLRWMLGNGGLEGMAARCERSAAILYGWAEAREWASPFVADPADRSPVVATVDLDPAIPAQTVSDVLRANGILDTEGYRALRRNQLRIAMYPAIEPDDVAALTRAVDHVVSALS